MEKKVQGAQEARFAYRVGDPLVPRDVEAVAFSGQLVVVTDTATVARVGDFFRATEGPLEGLEIPIVAVTTNSITLATEVSPAVTDQFFIMRYITQRTDSSGAQIVTLTAGPLIYVKDGASTEVEEDGALPANTNALPVKPMARAGELINFSCANDGDITSGAYVQLIASTAYNTSEIEIDNTTGKTLNIAFGAVGFEVEFFVVPTKGLSRQAIAIPAGTRISVIAAYNGTEGVGEVNVNLFY